MFPKICQIPNFFFSKTLFKLKILVTITAKGTLNYKIRLSFFVFVFFFFPNLPKTITCIKHNPNTLKEVKKLKANEEIAKIRYMEAHGMVGTA